MKKLLSVLLLIFAVFMAGCSDTNTGNIDTEVRNYCKTVEQAYEEGKSVDMLSKEKPVKSTIDTVKVNDELAIWIAEKEGNNLLLAPMLTNKDGYYFNGKETGYYIPDITEECDDESFWARYSLNDNKKLRFTVFRGNSYKGKVKSVKLKVQNTDYMLVYKIEK